MENKLQVVAALASLLLLVGVVELVRRRRLMERYALLWLFSGVVLLGLALWSGALSFVADLVGIETPSNALFVVAFGFVLLLLLHYSLVISTLTDRTKVLAQRVALLQQELDDVRQRTGLEDLPAGTPAAPVAEPRDREGAPR